ncbi:MAG: M20/M25/M40 family metallo-hydrolase [Lentisphaeria bacterium]|nr:M20/M25/M40 family metallo-hydrolase [Lentisphaeria bacterium]
MDNTLFKRVCDTPGIPGFEDNVQAIAKDILAGCCDEVTSDRIGNVIGIKKAAGKRDGRTPRLLLAAHADEIGMMVKHIDNKGFIHFIQVGGLNAQACESQRVVIHSAEPVRGVIVPKGGDTKAAIADLLVDTGLPVDEVKKRVSPGDPMTYEGDASILNDRMWVGRNFDDRAGTYCLLEAMRQVGETKVDVYAVSSVQEEVGLRGMHAAARRLDPDIAIAIDGSMARGAYVNDRDNLTEPGKGTGIYLIDKLTIGHPGLVRFLFGVAARHGIPHQLNIGGGTDASAIQKSGADVMATTIGAPTRYMHSTVQLCHADDLDATVDLLVKVMESAHELLELA